MLTGRLKTKAVLDSRHQSAEIRSASRSGVWLWASRCGESECADRMREGRALSGTKSL